MMEMETIKWVLDTPDIFKPSVYDESMLSKYIAFFSNVNYPFKGIFRYIYRFFPSAWYSFLYLAGNPKSEIQAMRRVISISSKERFFP